MTANNSPFYMPSEPKNGLDLVRWAFFEPVLLKRFSDKLTRKEALLWVLRAYPWIALFSVLVWIGGMGLIVMIDLPARFPQDYNAEFLDTWQQSLGPFAKLSFLATSTWVDSLGFGGLTSIGGLGLVSVGGIGVVGGVGGVSVFFIVGVAVDLVDLVIVSGDLFGLFALFALFGLLIGVVVGGFGVVVGGVGGVGGVGFGGGFGGGFGVRLVFVGGLIRGLIGGLIGGLGFISAFYIGYFRLLFYPLHFLIGSGRVTFTRNPYRRDGVIGVPLWHVDKKLIRLAKEHPEDARAFIDFLLEYRPLQQRLAARLTHAVTAGLWIQGAYGLQVDVFSPPNIPEKQTKFLPSGRWLTMLTHVQDQFRTSRQHTQIGLKISTFEEFLVLLRTLREQTLRESRKWNQGYLEALDIWLTVANERLSTLQQQGALFERITSNVYRSGEALHPGIDTDVFVGRDDLKDTLSFEILTARAMPMFLIQGQRRVGKTSLLNFLPDLLGPQFQVIFQDMQSERTAGVLNWLKDLRQRVNRQFRIREDVWEPPQDWLEAWSQMREHLEGICKQQKCKIILAFDEYENFHTNFQENPVQAEKLLGAMRSFSQHQNQVVFLFVGAKFFSELQAPNWTEYFVQIKHVRVDYLKQADTLKLIQQPVPEFNLVYPDDVVQRIFELTQGHPALVQHTCSELVNLANRSNRKHMMHDDLDAVLYKVDNCILSRENPTIAVFWSQFCSKNSPETAAHRTTLRQILTGQTPTDKASLFRLEQHGYIVKDGEAWKIRVPLFETWLRKYADTFE